MGSIAVDSQPGAGSIFHVRLRLERASFAEPEAAGGTGDPPGHDGRGRSAGGDDPAWRRPDRAALLERVGGDALLLGELGAMLVEDSLSRRRAEWAVAQRDAARIDRLAQLKLPARAANCSAQALERAGAPHQHAGARGAPTRRRG